MTQQIQDLLDRRAQLRRARSAWESHWQELAQAMHPRRADFTQVRQPGERRHETQYDGTPIQARRELAAAIGGLLMPKGERWVTLRAADEALNDRTEVKRWLRAAEDRLFAALYDPRANFMAAHGEVDDDLVTFGTAALFIGEGQRLDHLVFRALHLRQTLIAPDHDGRIDTVFLDEMLTARQAAQRFGREALGAKTREALDGRRGADPDARFEFVQAVLPRHERDPRSARATDLPFANVVIDVASDHLVLEDGFHEFPLAVPRWDTASGEIYGRSPGMVALPDANTLNQMGKTLLKAGQKAVDPPLLVASDSVKGTLHQQPGRATYFDADAARALGRIPVMPLQTGANLPLGREMQRDVREMVWGAFFRNVLRLPADGPQMTATEITQRRREFIQTIGPVFGRLEPAYPAVIVTRAFGILFRAGLLPSAPPVLVEGGGIRFRYASPIEKLRAEIDALGVSQWLSDLAPIAAVEPAILDNVDTDAAAKFFAEARGVPPELLRASEARGEIRAARTQGVVEEQAASDAERLIDGAARVSAVVQGAGAPAAGGVSAPPTGAAEKVLAELAALQAAPSA